MVWFLIPVAGSIGAAGAIYSLHAATNATSIYVAQKAHGESFDFSESVQYLMWTFSPPWPCDAGIEGAYTWPPLATMFEDRPQRHNGTVLGVASAVTVAIPTYVLAQRGMRRSVSSAASIGQPAKVESFAQLARSLAPGYAHKLTLACMISWQPGPGRASQ